MSQEPNASALSLDLIRWTFTSDPEHSVAIEEYLCDQGLDVLLHDECKFLVTWDEPDRDGAELIDAIWAINGAPFEVTQEEFHCLGVHTLYQGDDVKDDAA
jgi:hypothetical protein